MSMEKPYVVEVTVDAPRDAVWRALTEPEQLRHWFGWEYDGLEEEIAYIVGHVDLHPPNRIDLGPEGSIELTEVAPARTVIRAVKPGDASALEWRDVYGGVEEGWITFFNQLRHRIAHNATGDRRMLVETGKLAELPSLDGAPEWHSSRFQRGWDLDGVLVVVGIKPDGDAMLLVTTYGLDDARFAAVSERWSAWWARTLAASAR
jgi:uncharacterized protein YndB with AHSA1/START domain